MKPSLLPNRGIKIIEFDFVPPIDAKCKFSLMEQPLGVIKT